MIKRLSLPSLTLGFFALAVVSQGQTITPFRTQATGPGVAMSTADFNPQIRERNEFMPRILSKNAGLPTTPVGPANGLKAGNTITSPRGAVSKFFPGITFTGWIPPDPDLAVGPDYIVAVVNSDLAFFRKSDGVKVFQQALNGAGFFSGIGVVSDFTFDPKCFYDKSSGRYFVLICEQADAGEVSKALLAVSDDNNPNGTWYKYRIETKANQHWLDYPGFGFNKDAIVITGNMFPFATGGVFTQFVVIPKAPLLTGGTATAQYLQNNTMFTVQPARTADATQANIYGATALNSTTIRLVALRNPGTTPTLVIKDVAVPAWQRPTAVPVNGGRSLDGLDGRLFNCHFRGGRLVTSHTTKAADGRMKVRWYEFLVNSWPTTGNPALKQSGDILLAGTNTHMPAINTNIAGDIATIYTRNNASTNPETVYSARFPSDTLGSIGSPVLLQGSSGVYGGSGVNRWGDYFGCEIDPKDDLTFWGIGMVAGTGGNWLTTIHKWTVSSSSSGASVVAPLGVETLQGTFQGGTLASILNSDNSYYSVESYLIDKNGNQVAGTAQAIAQVASVRTDFDLDLSQGTLNDLKVRIEAKVSAAGSAGQVFGYNWSTGAYELAVSFALYTSDKEAIVTIPKTSLSKFVDSAGNVRLQIRGIETVKPGRGTKMPLAFVLSLDRIGLAPTFGS